MTTLLTGATGYLGGYVAHELLGAGEDLAVLVRAGDRAEAVDKLWRGWQLHLDPEGFRAALDRTTILLGDLHQDDLGLGPDAAARLSDRVDSVLHAAASLNRKSEKSCLNTNLRGTLAVVQLTRALHERRPLRRFGFVSTVAVAGKRHAEDVTEDVAIDWSLSDFDPYARTKKFCEHLVRRLLPEVPTTVYRPSIVMGDGHRPETSQFDMIFATSMLADLPVLPLDPALRVDICNAAWVGRAIAHLHAAPATLHTTYHLSAGAASPTVGAITAAIDRHRGRRPRRFAPRLEGAWDVAYRAMNRAPRGTPVAGVGALWKVFWPYVTFDTVFDNTRAVREVGEAPVPFPTYAGPLLDWVRAHGFRYPFRPLPKGIA